MAKFETNPSKEILTPQMRQSMRDILAGNRIERDIMKKNIAEDVTQKPYTPVPEEVRREIPQGLLEPASPGEAGVGIGTEPETRSRINRDLESQLNSKFDQGMGGTPTEAMPYQGPGTTRPVQLRGTRASSGDPLTDWVASNTINWEARRDKQGNVSVYNIPSGDYGGTKEVAGITNKYHPEAFKRISALPPQEREMASANYVMDYASPVTGLVPEPLRAHAADLYFNRGPGGYATLIQQGLNSLGIPVKVDGQFGQKTLEAMRQADPVQLIDATEDAYMARELKMAQADPNRMKLFRGIQNRSNNRRNSAKAFAGMYPEAQQGKLAIGMSYSPTQSAPIPPPAPAPGAGDEESRYIPAPIGLGMG